MNHIALEAFLFIISLIIFIIILNIPRSTYNIKQQNQPGAESRPKDENASQYHHESVWHAIAAFIHTIGDHLEAQNVQQDRHEHSKSLRDWITIGALAAAGIFAFGSNVILYMQLIDAREAATTQHSDAVKSFTATNRAFIFMRALGHTAVDAPGADFVNFAPYWHNSGGSPSVNLIIWTDCQVSDNDKRLDFRQRQKKLRFFLGPQTDQQVFACRFPRAEWSTLTDGKWLFTIGGADYEDIFGIAHTFEFCFKSSKFDLLPCDGVNAGHNCADTECAQD